MEGEAKEAFAAIPGLAAKGRVNPFVMIISDNDTKLSGRITADSFSMQPSFEAMAPLGWDVRKVDKGHDLQLVYTAVEQAIADAAAHFQPDAPRLEAAPPEGERILDVGVERIALGVALAHEADGGRHVADPAEVAPALGVLDRPHADGDEGLQETAAGVRARGACVVDARKRHFRHH